MADNINFSIIQGDKWTLEVYYFDNSEPPVPINISNYTILAEVRDKPGGSLICATATNGDGIELIQDGNYNGIKVTFSSEKTFNFNLPKSAYQVKISDTGDTLLSGWIDVSPAVISNG